MKAMRSFFLFVALASFAGCGDDAAPAATTFRPAIGYPVVSGYRPIQPGAHRLRFAALAESCAPEVPLYLGRDSKRQLRP